MGGSVKRAIKTPAPADKTRSSTRSTGPQPSRGPSKAAQNVLKHLTNGDAATLASRISSSSTRARAKGTGLTYLRVKGLKESKAVTNPDGGLKDLINFMERKASSFTTGRPKRQVMIKKVCNDIDQLPGYTDFQQRTPINQLMPVWGYSF